MDYSTQEDTIELFFNKAKEAILPSENNEYKSKFLQSNLLLYCVISLLILKITTTFFVINFPQNLFFADITKSTLVDFINQAREAKGIKPLLENNKLNQAAQMKAQNMVQNNYFDHTSPSGVTPWFWFIQAGYKYKYAGENLAIGFYESEEVYNAWLNSASHKANILNPNYTEVGTAVLDGFGANNSVIVVQEFGSQLPIKTATVKNSNQKPIKPNTNLATPPDTSNISDVVSNTTITKPIDSATINNSEQVLAQSTQSQILIQTPKDNSLNNLNAKLVNSFLYNYDKWLQNIIYGVSLVVIGILLILIFFNFDIKFKKHLIFRAAIIIILLSISTLINKEIIISLIPHQIFI